MGVIDGPSQQRVIPSHWYVPPSPLENGGAVSETGDACLFTSKSLSFLTDPYQTPTSLYQQPDQHSPERHREYAPPHNGLVHIKEYDIKDSNVEVY